MKIDEITGATSSIGSIGGLTSGIGSIGELTSSQNAQNTQKVAPKSNEFNSVLNRAIDDLNQKQVEADRAVADLATGEITDLHQAAIAIGKAENSMKLMLEIRNKAISAYKEVSRTQL